MMIKHPDCLVMIHNLQEEELKADPYNELETDPFSSNALNSSLWELETIISSHYDKEVRQLAKQFRTEFAHKQPARVDEFA